jgi:glycosyltransferase involved in cell wall biosynthesis
VIPPEPQTPQAATTPLGAAYGTAIRRCGSSTQDAQRCSGTINKDDTSGAPIPSPCMGVTPFKRATECSLGGGAGHPSGPEPAGGGPVTAENGRRKLRALLIGHSYVSIEIAQKKARALAQLRDLEVEVIAPRRFFELGRSLELEIPPADWGYRLHALPVALPSVRGQRHAYFFARGLRAIVRRFRPDVIDLWEEAYTAVSAQVSMTREFHARHARLILSPSVRVAKRQPLPFSLGEKFVISRCNFVVGRSPEVVDVMRAKGYRGPSTVIGHGIDLAALEPLDMDVCRKALDLPPGPLIVFLGRLVTDKGIDTLIEALQHVPSARLAIFGGGPEESFLRRLATQCGVEDRIVFRGPVPADRVAPVLNAGDVLAMPSRVERWGRVAIEALACGTPVVVGGDYLPTLVGSYGRVVLPDDPGALAAALTATLNEPMSERIRRAEAGRTYARQFSWEALALRWRETYEKSVHGE